MSEENKEILEQEPQSINPEPVPAGKKREKKTTIGGQALIEGVMMVGPKRTCMAVRKGDGTIKGRAW